VGVVGVVLVTDLLRQGNIRCELRTEGSKLMRTPVLSLAALAVSLTISSAMADDLHNAAARGDLKTVTQLLDGGADIDALEAKSTPLHWALLTNKIAVVQLLLERGANPNIEGPTGMPLVMATIMGSAETVSLLLDHGADPNTGSRSTPLIAAAVKNDVRIAELLLAHGADPNVSNTSGIVALHEAAKRGNLDLARLLVSHGADVNALTVQGIPPIHFAMLNRDDAVVAFLRDSGARAGKVDDISDLLASADINRGKSEANRICGHCHKFGAGENWHGPTLWGVVERPIASVAGFAYSPALVSRDGSWTIEAINEFIARPTEVDPGTKMETTGIIDRQLRADIIAYLASLR
jgi:cytochrome c